jgi:hypothetical protein
MYVDALRTLLGKLMTTVEDMWIERERLRELALEHQLATDPEVIALLEVAKRDPDRRQRARETFVETRRQFDNLGKEAAIETLLLELPPNDKLN